jgi:hypothetical protein
VAYGRGGSGSNLDAVASGLWESLGEATISRRIQPISDLTVSGGMPPSRSLDRKNLLYPGGTIFLTEYQTNKPHIMTTDQDPILLTAQQLAKRWDVSTMFIWRMRRDKKLQAYAMGERAVRYKFTEILAIEDQLKPATAGE